MKLIRLAVLSFTLAATSAMAAIDPALLSLVMPDAKILSGIQVSPSLKSQFGQFVLSQMNTDDQDLRKLIEETGFDPRRDLQEILVATTGQPGSVSGVLVLGKGVFNPGRISQTAKAHNSRSTTYKGIELLMSPDTASKGAFAFLDANTAVFGDEPLVRAAIDRRISGATALSGNLLNKAKDVASKNHAWFVTLTPLSEFLNGRVADQGLNDAMQGNLLQAVTQASGGVSFNAGSIIMSGEAVMRSDKDALALQDVMKFLAGVVQLNRDQPGANKAASLLDNTKFATEGNVLRLTMTLPEDLVEKLFVPQAARKKAASAARVR
jgi:hypothetical protein